MKIRPFLSYLVFIVFVMNLHAYTPRQDHGAKFEPQGKVLHGVGQGHFVAMANQMQNMGDSLYPSVYMYYSRLTLNSSGSIGNNLKTSMARYLPSLRQDTYIQLGLSFPKEELSEIADGEADAAVLELIQAINELGWNFFIRIGYEFNGSWNGYEPESYKKAFTHLTGLFRNHSDRIATVWCAYPDNMSTLQKFYPGDEYVDWWAIDLFESGHLKSNKTKVFIDSAGAHGKPVMIGESTAKNISESGQEKWNKWYKPYFDLIRDIPHIKAFCYINWDWDRSRSESVV